MRPLENPVPAAGQEFEEVVLGLEQLALQRLAASHQIPDPFFGLARDPDGREFPRAEES